MYNRSISILGEYPGKTGRLARFPDLDRPFHLFEKNSGTARLRRRGDPGKALRRLAFRASGRLARQAVSDAKCAEQERNIILALLIGCSLCVSDKWVAKTAAWPAFLTLARPEEGAPCCAENAPEGLGRGSAGARHSPQESSANGADRIPLPLGEGPGEGSPAAASMSEPGTATEGRIPLPLPPPPRGGGIGSFGARDRMGRTPAVRSGRSSSVGRDRYRRRKPGCQEKRDKIGDISEAALALPVEHGFEALELRMAEIGSRRSPAPAWPLRNASDRVQASKAPRSVQIECEA